MTLPLAMGAGDVRIIADKDNDHSSPGPWLLCSHMLTWVRVRHRHKDAAIAAPPVQRAARLGASAVRLGDF